MIGFGETYADAFDRGYSWVIKHGDGGAMSVLPEGRRP